MTINHDHNRQVQRDARQWARLSGSNYTTALRQVESPLARGILGEQITPQRLRDVLEEHPTLGEFGMNAEPPLLSPGGRISGGELFLGVVLAAEVLRMFTPATTPSISSYSLKHTAEWFLDPVMSYISNGQLIWAAAALGLPMSEPDDGPNVNIGVSEPEHTYARKALDRGNSMPLADYYRPAGWIHLRQAIDQFAETGKVGDPPISLVAARGDLAFHDWFVGQADRPDPVGNLADDYAAGVNESEHRIVEGPEDLLDLMEELRASQPFVDAAQSAGDEWRAHT